MYFRSVVFLGVKHSERHEPILLPAGARASARTAGTKIALHFPRLSVSLFVRPHLSRAQYITSYVTMQLQCIAALEVSRPSYSK